MWSLRGGPGLLYDPNAIFTVYPVVAAGTGCGNGVAHTGRAHHDGFSTCGACHASAVITIPGATCGLIKNI